MNRQFKKEEAVDRQAYQNTHQLSERHKLKQQLDIILQDYHSNGS